MGELRYQYGCGAITHLSCPQIRANDDRIEEKTEGCSLGLLSKEASSGTCVVGASVSGSSRSTVAPVPDLLTSSIDAGMLLCVEY